MDDGAQIKARIQSITDTKKVTDAMYMISSVKLTRAMREFDNTKPFFAALKQEIAKLFRHIPETSNRYFKVPDPAEGEHLNHGILLVTSDKGLSGAYNYTALGVCTEYISRHPETEVFIVGEYGRQYFAKHGFDFVEDFRYSAELPTVWKARQICADLLDYFDNGKVDEINIIYTDYIGVSSVCKRNVLLPLKRSRFASAKYDSLEDGVKTDFFHDPDTVLSGVIPSYLTGFIYSSLVDSYCSEQRARMNAMSSAGRNAEKMLRELNVSYNRARQSAITSEISEVTAGARALRAKRKASSGGNNGGTEI